MSKSDSVEFSLKKTLMAAEHEKVVDMVVSLYAANPTMQKQLDIRFAGLEEDPHKMARMIRKEFSLLKRSKKFIDYSESTSFAHQLDSLRARIVHDLNAKSPNLAFEVMLEFLNLHENVLNRVDDSNGSISGVFSMACDDLGTIAQLNTHLSSLEIVDLVFSLFMNNNYGMYDKVIPSFKNALGDKGMDILQEKVEKAATPQNTTKITLGLEAIADCKNDVEAFIRACAFAGKPHAHDHLGIAKRLIAHWRGKEALEWLNNMEIPPSHPWQQERKALNIQALELEGEYAQAQAERLAWFADVLSPTLYGDILKTAKLEDKEDFKSNAIKQAFVFPEPHTALHFLIAIQEVEKAAQFVCTRFKELSGERYYTLRPAADILKTVDPLAATLLYRKMIEPILEKTKSKYYSYAAKDLVMCGILNARITDWQDVQNHEAYLSDLNVNHKRKVSFWSQYQSALQKQSAKEVKLAKSS